MTAIKTQEHTLGRWSLADLFPAHDGKEMMAAIKQLEDQAAAIEKWRDKLSADISDIDFLSILQAMETNTRLSGRVSQFAGLFFAEDTQNQLAQSFQAQIDQKMAELRNRTLFFSLWWKSLDDKTAERLMKVSGAEFDYYLRQMRNFKPYTLAEPEEKVINIKDVTGASTLQTLYSSLTDRYAFKVAVDGETKEYTRAQLMQLIYGPDPDLRAAAYQELYRVFSHDGPILGQIYQALSRDWHNENIDLRKFSSPIAVRNLSNDIPDEVVDTLLGLSEENSRVFQRFFNLKARLLNTKRLRRYDIYAPVTSSDKRYSYEKAVNLTLDCFAEFDPKLETLAQQVFRAGHVDSEARKGKQGGAFCSSADPALMPWVLLNYTGLARDVSTLAHEFGHAIHAMLAGHHNVFNFHSSLPLAETASTFI